MNVLESKFFNLLGKRGLPLNGQKAWQISKGEHLVDKYSIQQMQNRQKARLLWGRPLLNRLTGFSPAPVVFLCWANYHVRLIVLLMTVINQVVLPNLWISSSFMYNRAGHTGWYPDVSSFGECNCVLVCNFACNSKIVRAYSAVVSCQGRAFSLLSTQISSCFSLVSFMKQFAGRIYATYIAGSCSGAFYVKVFSLSKASLTPLCMLCNTQTHTHTHVRVMSSPGWWLQMAYRVLNLSSEWHHPLPAPLQNSGREGGESERWFRKGELAQQ